MDGYLDESKLDMIAVDVDKLLAKVMELKARGAKVALLQIFEPQEDDETDTHIRKNLDFNALGCAYGGITDFNQIDCVSEDELDKAFWSEKDM